jgi:PAS domain S-box-containing protein
MPTKISSLIEKIFNIGQVVIVNIQKNDIPNGDFTLLFSTGKTLTNQDVIELFVNQVSLLIDRTKSEIMISKNESRYRSYIDNSPIAVFICDERGHYQQVNPAAEKIIGYSKQELLTMSIPDILPPESQDLAMKLFQTLAEKGKVDAEFKFRRKDGSIGLWSFNGIRLSPTEFMGLCIDVTARKKAEDDLLNSEQKFRTLIEQSPIAIEFYDSSGLLVNVNPACLKLFGIIDKKQIEKFALFDDPNISDDHKKMLAQAKPIHYEAMFDFDKVIEQKLYSTTKSGQIWLDVLITPTKDNADKANGYLVEIQDVSDKKTSITEMNDNLVKLEKMNSIMIGRELKMTELKAEIARLKQQIDR